MECALAGGNLMGDDDAWIIPSSSRCCMETSSAAPDFCFSFSILFWKLQHLDSTFLPFKGRSFVFHCLDTFCFLLFFLFEKDGHAGNHQLGITGPALLPIGPFVSY